MTTSIPPSDGDDIRVHKKKDGFMVIAPNGRSCFMNWWEHLRYKLTGKIPNSALKRVGLKRRG